MKVNSNAFLAAFEKEWCHQIERNSDEMSKAYCNRKSWTNYMLEETGFLSKVMAHLNESGSKLEYKREYYTLDALYVGGEDLYRDNKTYPSQLQVLIEHEQGEDIETEMWKLIFWRSPLKVIIFYDWNENEKTTEKRIEWLDKKLIKLISMLEKANEFFPENTETKYLFIIGNRDKENRLPKWRWASNDAVEKELKDLVSGT